MAKYVYPAVFSPNELGGFCVSFPDLGNVFTHGDDMPDAIAMAEDALCLMLYDMEKEGQAIPAAIESCAIKTEPGDIVKLVSCDTQSYKSYFERKPAKRLAARKKPFARIAAPSEAATVTPHIETA